MAGRTKGLGTRRQTATDRPPLPRWPLTALLAPFPLWWLAGLGTLIWPAAGVVMAVLLGRRGDVKAPKGFGIWLFYLFWITLSAAQLDSSGRVVGFAYRLILYLGCTAIFLYVYNMTDERLTDYLLGVMTLFFAGVVAGGYLGLLMPTLTITTPMAYVMPGGLLSNDLVREIVIIGTTQFNPDAWAYRDPRPSAPFLYTNNWGNAYSILLPLVSLYLIRSSGKRRFIFVLFLVLLSMVPAFLTLNRGMFLGLGVAAVVIALRYLRFGNPRGIVAVGLAATVVAAAFVLLPVSERLDTRLESSGSNESRLTVYIETLTRTALSPLFGYGAPRPAETVGVPPAGTQGQVWMVLFSHGYVGLIVFLLWFLFLIVRTLPRSDMSGITFHAVFVVTFVEIFYYGILVHGLALVMLVAALALRPPGNTRGNPGPDAASGGQDSINRRRGARPVL